MISRFLVLAAVLSFSCAGPLAAKPEYKQPRLELAVQYLQDALKADDPVPLMQKAKAEMEKVQSRKDGFRDRSISLIDVGIADFQGGKRDKVPGDITTALAAVQSAMAHR